MGRFQPQSIRMTAVVHPMGRVAGEQASFRLHYIESNEL